MQNYLKVNPHVKKSIKEETIDSCISIKDLFLHFDCKGTYNFHRLKSAWNSYLKSKFWITGYYTQRKKPGIEYWNECDENSTPEEIKYEAYFKSKIDWVFTRRKKETKKEKPVV